MITLDGDIVMVAGLPTTVPVWLIPTPSQLNVLGTTVILGPAPVNASLVCPANGDLGRDMGIIVIFVGVFAGETATLLQLTGMLTLVGEPGNVAMTVLPGDDTMPCELIVTVFVGDVEAKFLTRVCDILLPSPALLEKLATCTGIATG